MKMIRSFIAFDLEDKDTKENIQKFTNRLKQNQPRIKLVEPENLHITVKFLGDIPDHMAPKIYKILQEKVNDEYFKDNFYKYELRGVGEFRKYSVIWISMQGDTQVLQEIKDIIEFELKKELGIKKDKRKKLTPHLTIARLKSKRIDYNTFSSFKNLINKNKDTSFGNFTIDEIKLKKSVLTPKGPIYSNFTEDGFKD
ncbi:MAG: RNA 2',3'-cyclic phosphodiesterase [Candidatus Lokiarchaeota archaeon]|nr:RNA 2',3'-cyclic phosphodiesterase [Candidatus Lokiarchaeota archaeon]